MKANLPTDTNGHPVQTLRVQEDATLHLSPTEGAQARATLGSDAQVVRVATTGACWAAFGDSSVAASSGDANSFLFPAGVEIFYVSEALTHLSLRSVVGAGNVSATVTLLV